MTGNPPASGKMTKQDRLAAQLRANLLRRKQQARDQKKVTPDTDAASD